MSEVSDSLQRSWQAIDPVLISENSGDQPSGEDSSSDAPVGRPVQEESSDDDSSMKMSHMITSSVVSEHVGADLGLLV